MNLIWQDSPDGTEAKGADGLIYKVRGCCLYVDNCLIGSYASQIRATQVGQEMEDRRWASAPVKNDIPAGYDDLHRILMSAFDQSARGKGKERHANDKPFNVQPIMEIARMVGLGGHAYQCMKKTQEAVGMSNRGSHDAAIAEFKGVIVYAAAAIKLIEESRDAHAGV